MPHLEGDVGLFQGGSGGGSSGGVGWSKQRVDDFRHQKGGHNGLVGGGAGGAGAGGAGGAGAGAGMTMVPVDAAEMKRMKHELGDVDMETAFLESKAAEVEKGRSRLQKMRISVKEQQESLIKEQEELEKELHAIATSEQRITALQTSLRSSSLESSEVEGGEGEGEGEEKKIGGSSSGDVSSTACLTFLC